MHNLKYFGALTPNKIQQYPEAPIFLLDLLLRIKQQKILLFLCIMQWILYTVYYYLDKSKNEGQHLSLQCHTYKINKVVETLLCVLLIL